MAGAPRAVLLDSALKRPARTPTRLPTGHGAMAMRTLRRTIRSLTAATTTPARLVTRRRSSWSCTMSLPLRIEPHTTASGLAFAASHAQLSHSKILTLLSSRAQLSGHGRASSKAEGRRGAPKLRSGCGHAAGAQSARGLAAAASAPLREVYSARPAAVEG